MDRPDQVGPADDSMAQRFEHALDRAAHATDEGSLEEATRLIAALGRDLAERLALLAPALRRTMPGAERAAMIAQIRQLISGRDAA